MLFLVKFIKELKLNILISLSEKANFFTYQKYFLYIYQGVS